MIKQVHLEKEHPAIRAAFDFTDELLARDNYNHDDEGAPLLRMGFVEGYLFKAVENGEIDTAEKDAIDDRYSIIESMLKEHTGLYTFVGGLRGRLELAQGIIKQFESDSRLVFLGDYVDSSTESLENQAATFNLICEGAEQGRWDAIWGHHEMHYFKKAKGHRPGYNPEILKHCPRLAKMTLEDSLSYAPFRNSLMLYKSDLLVTHIGLSAPIADKHFGADSDPEEDTSPDWGVPFYQVEQNLYDLEVNPSYDYMRATTWDDFKRSFIPIDELKQVFSSPPMERIENIGDNYCISCLEYEVLQFNTETNEFRKVNIKLK